MRKQQMKVIAGFVAAAAILGIFTWQVGWKDILAAVSGADLHMLFLGMAVAFSAFVTPFGLLGGEPFIAYVLSRDTDIPLGDSFGAVMAADILNTVPFFTLSFLGMLTFLLFFPSTPVVSTILALFLVLIAIITVGFLIFWFRKDLMLRLFGGVGSGIATVVGLLRLDSHHVLGRIDDEFVRRKGERLYDIFRDLLQQKRRVVRVLILSHLANIASMGGLWLILRSFDVQAPLFVVLFVLPAAMLASYLPLPGGLGGIEVALTLLLVAVLNIPGSIASAATLLFRLATYWMIVLIGGIISSQRSVDVVARATGDG